MKEECLICKAPLEYLNEDIEMECELCHKKEKSKTRCINGHYVCNECHMQGIDSLVGLCLKETSKNPVKILNQMMDLPFCHMHGPEHHLMVGMALLTAYKNAGGEINLEKALIEMNSRGKSVPGGACGFWGACGAGISAGMFVSIVTGSTPLGTDNFALSHKMTSAALGAIGEIGGPRCCKRDSYLSIQKAVEFVKKKPGDRNGTAGNCLFLQRAEQPVYWEKMSVSQCGEKEDCIHLCSQFLQEPDCGGSWEEVSVRHCRLLFCRNRDKASDQSGCGKADEAGVRHRYGERSVFQITG